MNAPIRRDRVQEYPIALFWTALNCINFPAISMHHSAFKYNVFMTKYEISDIYFLLVFPSLNSLYARSRGKFELAMLRFPE